MLSGHFAHWRLLLDFLIFFVMLKLPSEQLALLSFANRLRMCLWRCNFQIHVSLYQFLRIIQALILVSERRAKLPQCIFIWDCNFFIHFLQTINFQLDFLVFGV